MTQEEIKEAIEDLDEEVLLTIIECCKELNIEGKYLKANLRIYVDINDNYSGGKYHVISLALGREIISETKLWL